MVALTDGPLHHWMMRGKGRLTALLCLVAYGDETDVLLVCRGFE